MSLYCDNCGGPRMNGSGVVLERRDGSIDKILSQHRPRKRVDEYWCRECVVGLVDDGYDPHR